MSLFGYYADGEEEEEDDVVVEDFNFRDAVQVDGKGSYFFVGHLPEGKVLLLTGGPKSISSLLQTGSGVYNTATMPINRITKTKTKRKMTVEEICDALGEEIEIVK